MAGLYGEGAASSSVSCPGVLMYGMNGAAPLVSFQGWFPLVARCPQADFLGLVPFLNVLLTAPGRFPGPGFLELRSPPTHAVGSPLLQKDSDLCQKLSYGHPTLSPVIVTLYCQHGTCYEFEVMAQCESPLSSS